MVACMATRKLTITLPDKQLQEIRALVATGQAANVYAFVQHAVGIGLSDAAGWREMLQEALEQTGARSPRAPAHQEGAGLGRQDSPAHAHAPPKQSSQATLTISADSPPA